MGNKADILLHPVRLRIVQALAGGRRGSAAELGEQLTDVPQATLYRQVQALAEAGVIAVVDERPARGTPERVYALVEGMADLSPADLAAATPEDHMRFFTMFTAGLLGDFARYLQRGTPDFVADGVGYRQLPLQLTDQEFAELAGRINAALMPVIGNQPAEGRRRRMFTTIVMPADEPAPDATTTSTPHPPQEDPR